MLIHLLPESKYLEEREDVAKDTQGQHTQEIRKWLKWSLIHVLVDKILTQHLFYFVRTRSSDVL